VAGAGGEDEVVEGDVDGAVVEGHAPRVGVDGVHLGHDDGGVGLVAEEPADGDADVGRVEDGGGDLVEEGLEEVVVGAVHQGDADGGVGEGAGGGEAGKAAADDHDVGSGIGGVGVGDAEGAVGHGGLWGGCGENAPAL